MKPIETDVLLVGSGHNGLVAATLLARAGLKVHVAEDKKVLGGATRTEYPFKKAPQLATSTASYLLGVMPPEIMEIMGTKLEVIRRDPHYFLPCLDGRYLLFGSDQVAMKDQFIRFFSREDWNANQALQEEIGKIRDDLAPSWMEEPISPEATAERYIRPELREIFVRLVREPAENYLGRFGFKSELLIAMYCVTDGFSGLTASFGTPGTGMNFLVHNMCRLPGSDGTFMISKGGMGQVSRKFAEQARMAGAEIVLGCGVERITLQNGRVTGAVLKDGREVRAKVVVSNADPFTMQELVGRENLPDAFNRKLDGFQRPGTTLKVNLALSKLPTFKCLPENRRQHDGTIHMLPTDQPNLIEYIRKGFDEVRAGRLAEFPTIEMYLHTQADPSLQDPEGRHNAAFFVQWAPYELSGGKSWDTEKDRYVEHLIDIASRFAPDFRECILEHSTWTPKDIEREIGIRWGHIHHVDNTFGFDERMPYSTPIPGLYSASAGCHPAGSVIGASGYNSAKRILKDLGLAR